MAPNAHLVELQTSQIIKYLFDDDDDNIALRKLDAGLEVDSPPGSEDGHFDPVIIGEKLRSVADSFNDDVRFKAAVKDLKQAAAQEAIEAAFSHGVDAIIQSQVCEKAEVALEVQLIKASVAFGLYVWKSSPELKNKVQSAMNAFLNRRVGPWVTQQGGWDQVRI
ncbi:hypothetical protein CgunFtcFv8_014673 [Champsocephalus gunnari]|uniref:Bcl-2-like protein 15 n=1 Tax=Champsocephalus gunnari TaxID=52237 RepID=A0AAN8E6I3_CHAGU|nr:hypothetical protein CgunFtcFv8_014673 [Champsocephalus gunnari]